VGEALVEGSKIC